MFQPSSVWEYVLCQNLTQVDTPVWLIYYWEPVVNRGKMSLYPFGEKIFTFLKIYIQFSLFDQGLRISFLLVLKSCLKRLLEFLKHFLGIKG